MRSTPTRRVARSAVLAGSALTALTMIAAGGIALPAAAAPSAPAELTVYVSPDGDDAASGTKSEPLATIAAARDALAGRTNAKQRGTVWIRGGEYVLDEAVTLEGDEDSWVTYAAYRGEDVRVTGAHALPADGWQKLADLTTEQLADPSYSSHSRLPDQVSGDVWVFDLGAAGIQAGTLYKNGFNWQQQPFAPELTVAGSVQTLAEYPNGEDCTTIETECHLWGSGAKWKVDAPDDLLQPDVNERFGLQDHWERSGTTPRAQFEDKKQTRDDVDTWPQEKLTTMTPSNFQVGGRLTEDNRYRSWAPEGVPAVSDSGERGFDEYTDVPVHADPDWIADIDNTRYETEGWLSGYLGNNYAADMVRILSWQDTTMYTKYASMYIPQDAWTKVKAKNILSELDAPGEYYIDRYNGNDVMYYLPTSDADLAQGAKLSAFDDNFFRLEGTTGVTLRDLKMSESLVSGVQLLDAHDSLIDGVEISNVSMDAVRIGENTETLTALPDYETLRGGARNVVQNSYLHDLGGGGVLLGGGDRSTLRRGDNVARHNEIARFSKLATYTPAGYLYGFGNVFENNEVYDAPHMAVQIMGNDMRITHNVFRDLVKNAGDQGVIYTGRDYTYLGNEIAYNLFDGIGGSNDAFYMDDGASGMRFHHNVIKDAHSGVYFQSGHSNKAQDNVFIDVGRTGHDQLYPRKGENKLPVSNSWVVESRFNSFLDVRAGEKYTATAENVAAWKQYYTDGKTKYTDGVPVVFPEIDAWHFPRATTGELCDAGNYATDATNGCSRAEVWGDPGSLYVPANIELDRSVVIGGDRYVGSVANFTNPEEQFSIARFNDKLDTNVVEPSSTQDAGFDLERMTFSQDGLVAATFGAEWVDRWNELVPAEAGRTARGDTAELWTVVAQAERAVPAASGAVAKALAKALGEAVEIGESTASTQQQIDAITATLRAAADKASPKPKSPTLTDDRKKKDAGGTFTLQVTQKSSHGGDTLRVYENGDLIAERSIDPKKKSWKQNFDVDGKVPGNYTYTCELEGAGGMAPCEPHTVKVEEGKRG
ncbi:right-handed parallel beta-helix repeat-containing protein [Microbacterium sp. H1-D42]|uniref:right-handed parallel beta-helix repeat-containing protein n=1 Tax=Microbacterium sp. H1-D42 TaxID=2925844 RepID=UPI001F53343A|nr:right-handed parallel beta-helix repeat-containing protein [Microbacterium sp. H1-D42]UNK70510.1 right-handed parallel beta-helix repeat-containing protein [Microbacterium sp. H1-D42]